MKKVLFLSIALFMTAALSAKTADLAIGFVNFKTCLEQSKQGEQERNAFDGLKKQMTDALEKLDMELADIAKKLEDQDYMDGLSPAAEEELKMRFQGLNQEFARAQNQYYQLLNQANYKMIQSLHDVVSLAAEKVRDRHHLSLLINEESTFAFASSLDFTAEVIKEMNTQFAKENE